MEINKVDRIVVKIELSRLECSDLSRICCEAMNSYHREGFLTLSLEAKDYATKLMKVLE